MNWSKKLNKGIEKLRNHALGYPQDESVYFFTFHKCASMLFARCILPNVENRIHVNPAKVLWDKPKDYDVKFDFKKRGEIYGPIRLSDGFVFRQLVLRYPMFSDI